MPTGLKLKDDALYHLDVGRVLPEWIDYNGHMNVAYYVLAFDHAVDQLFDAIGLTAEYRQSSGHSSFAAESHVTWKRELGEGDPIAITLQLLGFDHKRLHTFYRMYHAGEGFLAATSEWMQLSVNLRTRRSAPWEPEVRSLIEALYEPQRALPLPDEVGRVIAIPRPAPAG